MSALERAPKGRHLSLDRSTPTSGGPPLGLEPESTPPDVEHILLAFAPMHKAAFGMAIGLVGALVMALVTVAAILFERVGRFPLHYMAQFFYGYDVSWSGVAIGAGWAMLVGFVAGWFFAFCRNLVLAVSVFVIRTRAELAQTRDFLDHI
jgi:hypothetical protein